MHSILCKLLLLAAGLALLLAAPLAHAGEGPPRLLTPDPAKATQADAARLPVLVGFDLLLSKNKRLSAALPDRDVVLVRDRLQQRGAGDYSWFGKVQDAERSSVTFTVKGGYLYGRVALPGQTYVVEPDYDAGGYAVHKLDPSKAAPYDEGGVLPPDSGGLSLDKHAFSKAEDGSRIDLLILYTQGFDDRYAPGTEAKVQSLVDVGNSALANSNVNTQINPVATELHTSSSVSESVDITTALPVLAGDTQVAAMRFDYKADLVTLLREFRQGDYCGLAYVMQSRHVGTSGFFSSAYSVVEVLSLSDLTGAGSYCRDNTMIHEIGHNLGSAHNRADASVEGAFSYSYGYREEPTFATVMSYTSDSSTPRIDYFSNPNLTYSGLAIGKDTSDPQAAYNTLSLNNTRATAANFYEAANGAGANTAYITHLTGGQAGWTDTLVADNDSASSADFTVTLYAAGSQVYSGSHTVAARDQTTVDLKSLDSTAESGIVTFDEADLKFRLSYQSSSGGVAEFLLPTSSLATMGLYFSGYSTTVDWKGLAIANWGATTDTVTLYAMGDGAVLGSTTVSIAPNGRTSDVVGNYFPGLSPSVIEKIAAVSSGNTTGIVISGADTLDKLLFTNGVASDFTP